MGDYLPGGRELDLHDRFNIAVDEVTRQAELVRKEVSRVGCDQAVATYSLALRYLCEDPDSVFNEELLRNLFSTALVMIAAKTTSPDLKDLFKQFEELQKVVDRI